MDDIKQSLALVFTVSFLAYLVFHRYEPQKLLSVSCLLIVVPAATAWVVQRTFVFSASLPIFACYWLLLVSFTVAYRLSPLHPLYNIPGPLINKITNFRLSYLIAVSGDRHLLHEKLHRKHGDAVRIGPNLVSYCNIDVIEPVLGINGLPKGPYYCSINEQPALIYIKPLSEYGPRRRMWNAGFSGALLKRYQENIIKRKRELVDALSKSASSPADLSKWMEYFAFDTMGDMVFSFPFDLTKTGADDHGFHKAIIESVRKISSFLEVPWSVQLAADIVDLGGSLRGVTKMIVNKRLNAGTEAGDLFHHLTEYSEKGKSKLPYKTVLEECYVAIIAGSDTTSTVLASLWYFLLRNPACYTKIREELDATFPFGEEPLDQQRLSEMPYLNACLNEVMRLIPPAPSGSQRSVPVGSAGKMLGSHFIPGGTNVIIPPYSLQRDPRYFYPYPTSFWPDRWLAPKDRKEFGNITQPFVDHDSVILNTNAFIPFSTGPRVCPGKTVAMIELRLVASAIIRQFDMKPVEGFDFDEWESHLEDVFILTKRPLPVNLIERFNV